MTLRAIIIGCVLCLCSSTGVWASPPTVVVQPLTVNTPGIQAFAFELRHWDLRIYAGGPNGASTTRAEEVGRRTGASVVVNGGFFNPQQHSLGLLIDQGHLLNPVRKADWGILSVDRTTRRAALVHTRDWRQKAPKLPEFAIQAGPRLVVGGRPLSLKPQRARRTALGIRSGGKTVVLVVASGPILTQDLADVFVRLNCPYALNLDGGSSTQLWSSDSRIRPVKGVPVPNFVGIVPR